MKKKVNLDRIENAELLQVIERLDLKERSSSFNSSVSRVFDPSRAD